MACDVPARECLEWHIKPHLTGARPKTDESGYRALCPVHDDHEPSFGVSIGGNGKVLYGCFKGCDRLAVRRALIDNHGIDPACLPIPSKDTREVLDEIRDILTMPTKEDTYVRLLALARVDGHKKLPRGNLLVRLGALVGIARSTALGYGKRDREGPLTSTANNRQYGAKEMPVKNSTSERRVEPHGKSRNLDSIQELGPTEVQKPGPPDTNYEPAA